MKRIRFIAVLKMRSYISLTQVENSDILCTY